MSSRTGWLTLTAILCAVAIVVAANAPRVPGDREVVHTFFQAFWLSLAAVVCAAGAIDGLSGVGLAAGALGAVWALLVALPDPLKPVLFLSLVFVLPVIFLGLLFYSFQALIRGKGEPSANGSWCLLSLALLEAHFFFLQALFNGWT